MLVIVHGFHFVTLSSCVPSVDVLFFVVSLPTILLLLFLVVSVVFAFEKVVMTINIV